MRSHKFRPALLLFIAGIVFPFSVFAQGVTGPGQIFGEEGISKPLLVRGWLGSTNGSHRHLQLPGAPLRSDPSHPPVLKLPQGVPPTRPQFVPTTVTRIGRVRIGPGSSGVPSAPGASPSDGSANTEPEQLLNAAPRGIVGETVVVGQPKGSDGPIDTSHLFADPLQ